MKEHAKKQKHAMSAAVLQLFQSTAVARNYLKQQWSKTAGSILSMIRRLRS